MYVRTRNDTRQDDSDVVEALSFSCYNMDPDPTMVWIELGSFYSDVLLSLILYNYDFSKYSVSFQNISSQVYSCHNIESIQEFFRILTQYQKHSKI